MILLSRVAITALLTAAVVWPQSATGIENTAGVSTCSVQAWSTDPDPAGTNIRTGPRADAKVIGKLLAPKGTPQDIESPAFEIVGSKDGWLLIRNATIEYPVSGVTRTLFPGPGWISGGLAGLQLADRVLRSAPRPDAPIAAWINDSAKGISLDSFKLVRISGCEGRFVDVILSALGGKQVRGWIGHTCANQLTTCDMGDSQSAASFDCLKATTRSEKMICADSDLASLDRSLASEFSAALDVAPRRQQLRRLQTEWLSTYRDRSETADVMKDVYLRRLAELHEFVRIASALHQSLDASTLATKCIPLRQESDETCKVEESGPVGGNLFYQVQSYYAGDLRMRGGVVVLTSTGIANGRVLPVVWDDADVVHYDRPDLIASGGIRLLSLGASIEGTGHFNAGSLYHEVDGRWQEVDIESWQIDLAAKLPKDHAVWKGIYPDWKKMTADTPVWRTGDANCCATGGSAHVTLILRGDRVVLGTVQYSAKPVE